MESKEYQSIMDELDRIHKNMWILTSILLDNGIQIPKSIETENPKEDFGIVIEEPKTVTLNTEVSVTKPVDKPPENERSKRRKALLN